MIVKHDKSKLIQQLQLNFIQCKGDTGKILKNTIDKSMREGTSALAGKVLVFENGEL